MSVFESAKRSFGTSESNQKWYIPLSRVEDDEENGVENDELILTRYESDHHYFLLDFRR